MLENIISDTGYPVAWTIAPNGFKKHHVFESKQALIDAVPTLDQQNDVVYFGVGTLTNPKLPKVKKIIDGKEVWVRPYRIESNINSFQSLWMDIDIKPGVHTTITEASSALAQFCKLTGWPIPTIVSSGTGLHFYWPLTTPIDVSTWRSYWPHLIAVAKHTGLKLDVAASNKATQVMRPPGSTHRKDPANPRTVKVVRAADPADFTALFDKLKAYVTAHSLPLVQAHTPTANTFGAMMQAAGFTYTPPVTDRDPMKVIKGCAQIRRSIHEQRTEPEFRAVISTLMVLPHGRKLVHGLGKHQVLYDYDDVERKIDSLPVPPLPYTCDSFDSLTPGICDTCPHRGKIGSPVTLGNKVEAVELPAPDTPAETSTPATTSRLAGLVQPAAAMAEPPVTIETQAGAYKTDANGCWMIPPAEADEPAIQLCQQPVWALKHLYRVNEDGNREHYYLFRIETAPGKNNDVLISGEAAHSETPYREFTRYGVVIPKAANFQKFGNFMRAHLSNLVKQEPTEIFATLGWQPSGDFVTGVYNVPVVGQPYSSTNGKEATDTANNNGMKPTGDYAKWREAMDVFNTREQMHAQLCIGTAYAAPLFKFIGIDGLLLSLHGHSGIGKSAIQDAVASVWGDPSSLMSKAPATSIGESQVSVMRHIGMMKSLPVLLEELTNLKPEFMSDFIHGLCSGKEKSRLKPGARGEYNRTKGLTWSTAFLSSSNEAIADKLAEGKGEHIAERYRLFELTDLPLLRTGANFIPDSQKLRGLKENYGHAGLTYARWMQANIDKIPGWIEAKIAWITQATKSISEERFWVQGMAAWLVGLELAHDAGLHSFDMDSLHEYVVEQFEIQRYGIRDSKTSTETNFAEMINDMLPNALIIDTKNELVQGMTAILPRRGSLHMRLDLAEGVGAVTVGEVKNWCHRRGIGLSAMRDSGVASGLLTRTKATQVVLGKGVKELSGGSQVYCYIFEIPADSKMLLREQLKEKESE